MRLCIEHFKIQGSNRSILFTWKIFISRFIQKCKRISASNANLFNFQLPMLTAYLAYLTAFFYFPMKFLLAWELNCACSFIITCEMTRIAMKLHSFLRENMPRAIAKKTSGTVVEPGTASEWPSVEQYVYFMFCPSLIYRDEYPR
ncbi:hypothetical protein COOONC_14376 [Cooperia oncophora]